MSTLLVHAIQAISTVGATTFVSGLWEAAALALFVWLSLRIIPRTSAATRFAAWMIAFTALVFLPFAGLIPRGSPASAVSVRSIAPTASFHLDPRWALAIAAVWIVGTLARFGALVWNLYRLRALWRDSIPVDRESVDPSIRATLIGRRLRAVELRISDRVNAPCAIGFFQPAIVIPRWLWQKLTTEELKQIVLHETAHLVRRDDWTNLFQKLALAVFPLNPGLLWMERRLCFDREMACDDAVLSAAVPARTYAACLTGLAEKKLRRRTTSLAPGAWTRQSELVHRVHSILRQDRNSSPLIAKSVAAGCVVATLGGALVFARVPELISFAPVAPAVETADVVSAPSEAFVPRFATAKTVKYQEVVARQPKPVHRVARRSTVTASAPKPSELAVSAPIPTAVPLPEFRQVGILQSAMTGQSWLVLSVWRSTPIRSKSDDASSSQAPQPASDSQPVKIQTGWILIQI
jgi:beta-lactamase regulating signal transducer with metallopeptidase domain